MILLFLTCQDDIVCVKIAATTLNINRDVFVGLCYVLPDYSSRQSVVENCISVCNLPDYVSTDNSMYMTVTW